MQTSIARLDLSLPLPAYETAGAVAFDFVTRATTVIQPKTIGLIPGNVIVETPQGYVLLIVPRSSLPRKKTLMFPHSIGIIDQDYCGPGDEIMIQVYNFGEEPVTVERGERIAQGIFMKCEQATWLETDIRAKTRGGFGSTGSISHPHMPHTPLSRGERGKPTSQRHFSIFFRINAGTSSSSSLIGRFLFPFSAGFSSLKDGIWVTFPLRPFFTKR